MSAGLDELRRVLGAEPPDGLAALSEDALRELAAAIAEAERRQIEALRDAGEAALGHVPRLLRGPLRKVLM